MKKLMELNFFDKKILSSAGYWGMYVKHNIASHTPTIYLAKADTDNNQHRKWHTRSIATDDIEQESIEIIKPAV